jgi:hypothetical protein
MEVSSRTKMIELISIHIPKTAGSSFFQLLKKVYGKEAVLKLNSMEGETAEISESITDATKVIHGHLQAGQLREIIAKNNARVITWMRDPVERVISNYYFSMQRIREGKARSHKLQTREFSLLEYAVIDENRNKASWFLDSLALEDIFFIGIYEQLENDISRLSQQMGWPTQPELPHRKSGVEFVKDNDCSTAYRDIDGKMRSELAELNSLDVDLYQQALRLREVI